MSTKQVESEENSAQLTKFLAENYAGRFVFENSNDVIQPPYIVAYHHYERFNKNLKKPLDILYEAAMKFPQLPFAIAEIAVLNQWTRQDYNYNDIYQNPITFGVDKERRYHIFRNVLDVQKLTEFCEKLLANQLFKSEPLPTQNTAVKTAVALNIQEVIVDNPKDVFVTFYYPWCRFAMELHPILDEIAEIFQRNGNDAYIDLVRMNCETNFVCESWHVSVSPMCYFIRRNDKNNLIRFDVGPRTKENLMHFMAINATHDLHGIDEM